MTAEPLAAWLGVLALAPFIWSALVALARRGAAAAPLSDAHEKAVLAIMLAPIALGAALMLAPREAMPAFAPPLLDLIEPAGADAGSPNAAAPAAIDWPLAAALTLLALYAAGLARHAAPLAAAHLRLHRWASSARPHPTLRDVYLCAFATTPLAAPGRRVLFPRILAEALPAEQIALVVEHERQHHARGDVAFYALLAWIDAILWFNPFMRAQTRHCRLAAELACDAAVTAAAPQMRRTYAQALLQVLKHTAGDALPCAPAVFSHRAMGDHRMRILEIMKPRAGAHKRPPWLAYAAALALAAPLAIGQLALAQSSGGATPAASAAPVFSHAPTAGRVTAGFGPRNDPFSGAPAFHGGVDIAAPLGTPVVAPAAGRVTRIVLGHEGYGDMIEVDHGGGYRLRYAQLSRIDVREGESVSAGQQIGGVGNSGRATGTHLHFEVWREGVPLDPATVVPLQ